jgi:hypothetical protein
MNYFRTYLYGAQFTVYTDNIALQWLKGLNNPAARLARWSILLSQFDYEIIHRPGRDNKMADYMSRPVLMTIKDLSELETNALEDAASKMCDPYVDNALLTYLKTGRHQSGASKTQIKRVERAATSTKYSKTAQSLLEKTLTTSSLW